MMKQSETELELGTGVSGELPFEFKLRDDNIWFSQNHLGRLLGSTKQNISSHFRELKKSKVPVEQKAFLLSKKEGTRTIKRKIQHVGLRTALGIALRSSRYKEHEQLILLAKKHHVYLDRIPITAVKERTFSEMLREIFRGIIEIKTQVRFGNYIVDFLLPSLNIAIEYDECHHTKPSNITKDSYRQIQIESESGLKFIRIKEGEEYKGLNEILRILISSEASRICIERGFID